MKKIRNFSLGSILVFGTLLPLGLLSCSNSKTEQTPWKKTYFFQETDLQKKLPPQKNLNDEVIEMGYQTIKPQVLNKIKLQDYDSFVLHGGNPRMRIHSLPTNFWDAFPNMTEIIPYALTGHHFKALEIPSWIQRIHYRAFSGCRSLEQLSFQPYSELKTIHNEAFGAHAMKEIDIPASVEFIGEDAFSSAADTGMRVIVRNKNLGKHLAKDSFVLKETEEYWNLLLDRQEFFPAKMAVVNTNTAFGLSGSSWGIRVVFGDEWKHDEDSSWVGPHVFHRPTWTEGPIDWNFRYFIWKRGYEKNAVYS